MGREVISDEIIVLRVKDWQQADKYVIGFGREQGKLRFIAYGARYPKNLSGRLLQPFARLRVEVQSGERIDKLLNCELSKSINMTDIKQVAYASVITELAAIFTEDREPLPELYELLCNCMQMLAERNPRLVTLIFAVQLLGLTGLLPQTDACVICSESLENEAWFSSLHGGTVCADCRIAAGVGDVDACHEETRKFWKQLEEFDFHADTELKVRGGTLMEMEKLLYHFILFQTDRPLKSLAFVQELGL